MKAGNILLNQFLNHSIKEIVPKREVSTGYLSIDENNHIEWVSKDDYFKKFNFYHKEGRIGLGREPLFTYNFDIKVNPDTITTALHIGDGSAGFSMGNGTSNGFIPEIIGLGINKDDAGLYLIGKTNNTEESKIPLIILDGRGPNGTSLKNRPILGVTSADYNDYKLVINQDGNVGINKYPEIYNLEVGGIIQCEDIKLISAKLAEQLQVDTTHEISLEALLLLFAKEIANLKKLQK